MTTRIMVINDSAPMRELFREILIGEGYEVEIASSDGPILDKVCQIHPDLVIMDYALNSHPQGWCPLEQIKQSRSTADLPVIVCTGALPQVRAIDTWLAEEHIPVVSQPFDIDDLLAAIEHQLYYTCPAQRVRQARPAPIQ